MIRIKNEQDLLQCIRNELVPENPYTNFGLKGLLSYRINTGKRLNKRHPHDIQEGYDSLNKHYYGISVTSKVLDKIFKIKSNSKAYGSCCYLFNTWSLVRMFAESYVQDLAEDEQKKYWKGQELWILKNYKKLECNFPEIFKRFDTMSDRQHCLANMIPVPTDFKSSGNRDGKGNFREDNDMPDLFYQRSEEVPLHSIKYENCKEWIDDHSYQLSLQEFTAFN